VLVVGGLALVLPVVAPWLGVYHLYVVNLSLIYLVGNLGYGLVLGHAGQISLCQGAFVGLGAYLTALLALRLALPVALALPLAAVITGAVGFLLGMPALRLSGHYLALVTLGFNTIFEIVVRVWVSMTNGSYGLKVPRLVLGAFPLTRDLHFFYLSYAVVLVALWVSWNLVRSRVGRAMSAVRGSEVAAVSLGIDVARAKTLAFGLSGLFGALGGGLFAVTIGIVSPDDFGLPKVLRFLTMLVVGGLGSLGGTVVGTVLLTVLPEALRFLKDFEELMYGLLLLLSLNLMPRGIAGLARDLYHRWWAPERAFVVSTEEGA
jgi:ABC-type branched-subunit amino acid transport system permease subunit